jgi:hypothetical protein
MLPQISPDLIRVQTFWNLAEIHDAEPAGGYEATLTKDFYASVRVQRQSHARVHSNSATIAVLRSRFNEPPAMRSLLSNIELSLRQLFDCHSFTRPFA